MMTLPFYIGLLAGAIFFIDAWGPSKEKIPFVKSRRFRGLAIILSGGIITPAIDLLQGHGESSKLEFFLGYLRGCVVGWFLLFALGLVLFVVWKLARASHDKRVKWVGEFAFITLDFIYLGISDNPHLNAKRDSDILIDRSRNDAVLQQLQKELETKGTAPKDLDLNIDTQRSVAEYIERLIGSTYEKYYTFHDWYYKAIAEYNKNEYEKTITYIKNALEKESTADERAEAHLYMAIAYDELGLKTKAMEEYDLIIDRYPNYKNLWLVWYDKATSLYETYEARNYKKAAAAFERAVLLNDARPDPYYNQGLNFVELKEYSKALQAFEKAQKLQAENADILERIAEVLIKLDRQGEALAAIERALTLQQSGDLYFSKAELLQDMERTEEALSAYSDVLQYESKDIVTLYRIGLLYQKKKEYTKALDYFDQVLAREPSDIDTLYQKALVLDALEEYAEALEVFEHCLEKAAGDADVWFDKATVLEKMGRLEDSLKAYNKALSLDKHDAVVWFRKGALLDNMDGEEDAALKAYDKAIQLQPNYIEAWYNKATLLAYKGRNAEARDAYQHVLDENEANEDAWFSLGTVLENMGNYDAAREAYGKALALNEHNSDAWFNMGTVLEKLGREEESAAAFARATSGNGIPANGALSQITI